MPLGQGVVVKRFSLPRPISVKFGELGSPKTDTRADRGGYVSGSYVVFCPTCGDYYVGNRASGSCADCAYEAK